MIGINHTGKVEKNSTWRRLGIEPATFVFLYALPSELQGQAGNGHGIVIDYDISVFLALIEAYSKMSSVRR